MGSHPYATWNLGLVHIVDKATGNLLCQIYPIDKTRNASAERRRIAPEAAAADPVESTGEPPLLRKLMEEYAATGAPAYIPKDEGKDD